jgi:hypothetical protein
MVVVGELGAQQLERAEVQLALLQLPHEHDLIQT